MITLVNAQQPPGYYNVTWNGKNSAGKLVPGGVYLYRLQAGDYEEVRKMMVVRYRPASAATRTSRRRLA